MLWKTRSTGSGGHHPAAGAEVPLEVADPQDHVGDGRGPGVDLDAQELVGVDREAGELQAHLALAELVEGV